MSREWRTDDYTHENVGPIFNLYRLRTYSLIPRVHLHGVVVLILNPYDACGIERSR